MSESGRTRKPPSNARWGEPNLSDPDDRCNVETVDRPTKWIAVAGMWLLLAPWVIGLPFAIWHLVAEHRIELTLVAMMGVVACVILYRTTRNYLLHRRRPQTRRSADLR